MDAKVAGADIVREPSVLRKAKIDKRNGKVDLTFLIECVSIDAFAVILQKTLTLTVETHLLTNKNLTVAKMMDVYLSSFVSREEIDGFNNLEGDDALFFDCNKVKLLADLLRGIAKGTNNNGEFFFIKSIINGSAVGKYLCIKIPCFSQFSILREISLSFHDTKESNRCDLMTLNLFHTVITGLVNEEKAAEERARALRKKELSDLVVEQALSTPVVIDDVNNDLITTENVVVVEKPVDDSYGSIICEFPVQNVLFST